MEGDGHFFLVNLEYHSKFATMKAILPRFNLQERVMASLGHHPVTALLGPRQSGKTWLARTLRVPPENYFDLEDDVSLVRLESGPQSVLDRLSGVVVIDEIQRRPQLFTALRVLADRPEQRAKFLILGSASPALLKEASESLAGRVNYIDMAGFHLGELDPGDMEFAWQRLWTAGGFPRAFLETDPELSHRWRQNYLRSLAERDLRELAETKMTGDELRKLLLLVAHQHGQAWNHSAVASHLGITGKTVQRHMELLKAAFIVREIQPWFANVSKRLRKASRYYYRDSGLLHALLGLKDHEAITTHPVQGHSWEGFCIEQIIRGLELDESRCFCYGVQSGTEMDMVVETARGLIGFEFKANPVPARTRSMTESIQDLGLERVFVIHPGERRYELDATIEAVPLKFLHELRDRL
jgi:predicted AAA+ superfamily ATPase